MDRKRIRIFVVFAAVIGIIGWLFVDGFEDTMVYYTTVNELQAKGKVAERKGFRVSGTVVPGSVVKADDGLSIQFVLEEQGHELNVQYHGIVPDTFKDDIQVLLEGKYRNNQFSATQIFTKCASKYEGEEGGDYNYSKPGSSS